jgi:hypothetical protein
MTKHKEILFTFGSLKEEDLSWDISFWQSTSTEERFKATTDLIRTAYNLKNNSELEMKVSKDVIEFCSIY